MANITDTQLASTTTPQGASLVGYRAAASGAVGRTELAKWQEHNVVTPEDFGARGDTLFVSVNTTAGSANIVTPNNSGFTSADVGKIVSVVGAGASGASLLTTITAYVSANTVTIGTAASTAVTNGFMTYGSDDTNALQAWLTQLGQVFVGKLGPKTYLFTAALTKPFGNNIVIRGDRWATRLIYAGTSTTIDLLTFGGAYDQKGCLFEGFTIDSATKMTNGHALVWNNLARSAINYVTIAGQDSPYNINRFTDPNTANPNPVFLSNLWNGGYLHGFDGVEMYGHDCTVRNIGWKLSGNTNDIQICSDVYFTGGGKVGGCGGTGVWIGGGCGGVILGDVDVIGNSLAAAGSPAVLIDNGLISVENREISFNGSFAADSTRGPGVVINDTLVGTGSAPNTTPGYILAAASWFASSSNGYPNFWVKNWGNTSGTLKCIIQFLGGTIYNGSGSGLQVDTTYPMVYVRDTLFRFNKGAAIQGGSNVNIRDADYLANTGANINGAAFENTGSGQAVINSLGYTPANIVSPQFQSQVAVGDGGFVMGGASSGTPTLQWDSNQYDQFTRSTKTRTINIDGVPQLSITSSSIDCKPSQFHVGGDTRLGFARTDNNTTYVGLGTNTYLQCNGDGTEVIMYIKGLPKGRWNTSSPNV